MIQKYKEFIARKCEELRIHEEVSAGNMLRNMFSYSIFQERKVYCSYLQYLFIMKVDTAHLTLF